MKFTVNNLPFSAEDSDADDPNMENLKKYRILSWCVEFPEVLLPVMGSAVHRVLSITSDCCWYPPPYYMKLVAPNSSEFNRLYQD